MGDAEDVFSRDLPPLRSGAGNEPPARIMLDVVPTSGWRTAFPYALLSRVELRSADELGVSFGPEGQVTVRGKRLESVYEALLAHSLESLKVSEGEPGEDQAVIREVSID